MGLFSRKRQVAEPPLALSVLLSNPNSTTSSAPSAHDKKTPSTCHAPPQVVITTPPPLASSGNSVKKVSAASRNPSALPVRLHIALPSASAKPDRRFSNSSGRRRKSRTSSLAPSQDTLESCSDSGSEYDLEPHDHSVQPRAVPTSQLSALMGLCGLLRAARDRGVEAEEPRRTVSLLRADAQIPRFTSEARPAGAVIGEPQLELIKTLRSRLTQLTELDRTPSLQHAALEGHATLYEKYGVLSEVVGRGAYGVIRMAGHASAPKKHATERAAACAESTHHKVYAVKELQQRPEGKNRELYHHFIDRVVSEFVLLLAFDSPHLVRAFDILVTLAPQDISPDATARRMKVSQVMEYTGGGDLLSYCLRCVASRQYLSIEEIDCMVKQIASGLQYMHQHGVAHCDVKLENVLISYMETEAQPTSRAAITLKLSDFGKSNVFRTKWDTKDQRWPSENGPLGSEPYMAPEEHVATPRGVSLAKKDSWGLGVVILCLFNLRQSYFQGRYGDYCLLKVHDVVHDESVQQAYPSTLLWASTEPKGKKNTFKDAIFAEYAANCMKADYSDATKEWTILRAGRFVPIETLFAAITDAEAEIYDTDDFDLRKYSIYKLLDLDGERRLSTSEFIQGDWMADVQCCSE